jgi:hypothetical protein
MVQGLTEQSLKLALMRLLLLLVVDLFLVPCYRERKVNIKQTFEKTEYIINITCKILW